MPILEILLFMRFKPKGHRLIPLHQPGDQGDWRLLLVMIRRRSAYQQKWSSLSRHQLEMVTFHFCLAPCLALTTSRLCVGRLICKGGAKTSLLLFWRSPRSSLGQTVFCGGRQDRAAGGFMYQTSQGSRWGQERIFCSHFRGEKNNVNQPGHCNDQSLGKGSWIRSQKTWLPLKS